MIAVAQFIGLPLLFFSSLLIARALIPAWMQDALAPEPGRVGRARARGARRCPAPTGARWAVTSLLLAGFVGAHRRLRDLELPLLPADALTR